MSRGVDPHPPEKTVLASAHDSSVTDYKNLKRHRRKPGRRIKEHARGVRKTKHRRGGRK